MSVQPTESGVFSQEINGFVGNRKGMEKIVIRILRIYWDDDHKNARIVLEGATIPGLITNGKGKFMVEK